MAELKIKINCGKKTCGKCKKKYYNGSSFYPHCSIFDSPDGEGKILFETDDGQILRLPECIMAGDEEEKENSYDKYYFGKKK
jgi:hypothetical protein